MPKINNYVYSLCIQYDILEYIWNSKKKIVKNNIRYINISLSKLWNIGQVNVNYFTIKKNSNDIAFINKYYNQYGLKCLLNNNYLILHEKFTESCTLDISQYSNIIRNDDKKTTTTKPQSNDSKCISTSQLVLCN